MRTPSLRLPRRLVSLSLATAAAALVAPAAASAADCSTWNWYSMDQSKPFKEFGDNANYWVMIGGGFEKAAYWGQWKLGTAKVAAGNEPFGIYPGRNSLALQNGTSATTPQVCVNPSHPSFRFAMRASMAGSKLETFVNFTTLLGAKVSVPARVNVIEQGGGWLVADSQPLATLIPAAVLKFGTTASITFKATTPTGGKISIDSVMVDPYRRG